jgi:hypothetical protein
MTDALIFVEVPKWDKRLEDMLTSEMKSRAERLGPSLTSELRMRPSSVRIGEGVQSAFGLRYNDSA